MRPLRLKGSLAQWRSSSALRDLLVLAMFVGIAVLYVRPLFTHLATRIVSDPGDPALNAAVLWWNATTVPFTAAWWNQPWFYPATGITAFTENLVGLWPIATPAWGLTQNPVAAYNLTLFASFPLSAFACYFLVRRVTGRRDAGIIAGLAFAFTPYRASVELGHLQSLSAFWLPIALGALHAYLERPRARWLVVFGAAWVMQSLANGYYMLFGAVLIALWLAYFGTTARTWRSSLKVIGAWATASLLLLPVVLRYQRIHDYFGLRRTLDEARAFSAHLESWLEVPEVVRSWSGVLPAGQDNLFPGLTAVVLVAVAALAGLMSTRSGEARTKRRVVLQAALVVVTIGSFAAAIAFFIQGTWSIRIGDAVLFKMSHPERAHAVLVLCGIPLLWISSVRDVMAARHPFLFYAIATVLMALLACGPVLTMGDRVILDPSPYRWLMALPGFDHLRVPSRFWMMGALCLSAAAGIGYAAVVRAGWSIRHALFALAAAGILADGWVTSLPMKPAPALWTTMRGTDASLPLLELPLGPGWDAAATLRATTHGRKVMNGVSGYSPPYYDALHVGLRSADPEMLEVIASLGTYEVSIEHLNDRDGRWREYVAGARGASVAAEDETRVIFRVPAAARDVAVLGAALPIQSVRGNRGDASRTVDRTTHTAWVDAPQTWDQWLLADLGRPQLVGGVSLAIAEFVTEFPRHVVIDVSSDGEHFTQVWESSVAPSAFLAILLEPRTAWLRFAIPPHETRFVRIRQMAWENVGWAVPELEINAPARKQ